MKKSIFLTFIFSLAFFFLSAQKKFQPYLGTNSSIGYSFWNSEIQSSDYIGYQSRPGWEQEYGLSKEKLPFSYGGGFEVGVVFNEKLMVGTGVKFLHRQMEGVYYCHVCDLLVTELTDVSSNFIEIPLRVQYNLIEDKPFFPIVSAELYWSKPIGFELEKDINFMGAKVGVGVARKFGSHQLNAEIQFNKGLDDKNTFPNYQFQELQLGVRWTTTFFNK